MAVWIHRGRQRIAGPVCAIRKSKQAIGQAQRRLSLKPPAGNTIGPETRKYTQ